eukprot:gene15066-17832_t
MSIDKNYVFVTVGTTRFEELIEAVDTDDFHQLLKGFGYSGMVMQIGNSQYVPNGLTENQVAKGRVQGFNTLYYRFKPTLADDMAKSSLIISHGGSGSILEALELHKPCVCVTNSRLMHNHQVELAGKLSHQPYSFLLPCEPSTLCEVVKNDLKSYLATRQTMNERVVDQSLSRFCEQMDKQFSQDKSKLKKSMVVLGSGGHTAEMFYLLKQVDRSKYKHITYVLADSDQRSEDKIHINDHSQDFSVKRIPRSRNVGQSYINSGVFPMVDCILPVSFVIISLPCPLRSFQNCVGAPDVILSRND